MNNKGFTDELFQKMYDCGYKKAEIEGDTLFFFLNETENLRAYSPCVPVKCTCFKKKDQLIDVAEYLGIVDWSKVPVDTPILVSHDNEEWSRRYFAKYERGSVFAFRNGATSWSGDSWVFDWKYAKLASAEDK